MVRKGKRRLIFTRTFDILSLIFALLTYGARFGQVDDDFMLTIIKSINFVSAVRLSTKFFGHFVPILRVVPESTSQMVAAERVHRKHRDALYDDY